MRRKVGEGGGRESRLYREPVVVAMAHRGLPPYLTDGAACPSADQYRRRTRHKAEPVAMIRNDSGTAAWRWTQLRAGLGAARAQHSRLLPSVPTCRHSDTRPSSASQQRARRGLQSRSASHSDMTTVLRTSTQPGCRSTASWKSYSIEDRSNYNDPAAIDVDNVALVNRRLNSGLIRAPGSASVGHVMTDNFRFTDAERNWMGDEEPTRYVDENMTRCVRRYHRRTQSSDEDSDNADRDDEGNGDTRAAVCFSNQSRWNRAVSVDRTTPACSEYTAGTPDADDARCAEVERRNSSALKRSRSRSTEDPLFTGHGVQQQAAIDDLLSLDSGVDQPVQPDTDHEGPTVRHHNCCNEFVAISNEIRHICLHNDDP